MKSPIRYVGGKSWLVEKLVPEIIASKPQTYIEPFLGGGAIALALPVELPKILGDVNPALMDVWRCLQRVPNALHAELTKLETIEASSFWNARSSIYYNQVRAEFNALVSSPKNAPAIAARFLFLNARCFNGLWRTSEKSGFNVPYGKIERPKQHSLESFQAYSQALKNATFVVGDYSKIASDEMNRRVRRKPLFSSAAGITIYTDPPYDNGFTDYVAGGFNEDDQRALARHLGAWAKIGAKVFATNADTPLVREIYRWADLEEIDEHHSVGSTGARRGKKPCLLIRNKERS